MKVQVGPRLRVPVPRHTPWFVKTTKNPDLDGEMKRQFWPIPQTSCLISRMRNGLLFTNRYFSHGSGGEMVVSCGEGRRLAPPAGVPGGVARAPRPPSPTKIKSQALSACTLVRCVYFLIALCASRTERLPGECPRVRGMTRVL